MAYSQAHDFTVTDSAFNDVHGDYNHNETTSNPQSINSEYDDSFFATTSQVDAVNDTLLPSFSVAGAHGSNVGGNQTNNIYITLPTGYRLHGPSSTPPSQSQECKTVDISVVLDSEVERRRENLNWRLSIVDLMKVLRMDSSFAARKRLASGAGYIGDQGDSRLMNIWLLRHVKDVITVAKGDLTVARVTLMRKMSSQELD